MSSGYARRWGAVLVAFVFSSVPAFGQDPTPGTFDAKNVGVLASSLVTVFQAIARGEHAIASKTLLDIFSATNVVSLSESDVRTQIDRAARRMYADKPALNGDTSASVSGNQQQVTIVADKNGVNGRARLSLPLSADGHSTLQLTFEAPLSSGDATFLRDGMLSGNSSIEGTFNYTWWKYEQSVPTIRQTTVSGATTSITTITPPIASLARTMYPHLAEENALPALLGTLRAFSETTGLSPVVATLLATSGPRQLATLFASSSLVNSSQRFWAAVAQLPTLMRHNWTGYLRVGYQRKRHTIGYLTEDAFESKSFDGHTSGVTGSFGVSRSSTWKPEGKDEFQTPNFFAGVTLDNLDRVNVGSPRNICRPLPTLDGGTECIQRPVGVPTIDDGKYAITVELRKWALNQSVGINPKYTWSRAQNVRSELFELPIYLMHQVADINKNEVKFGADLVGGVNVGYQRRPEALEGVFVTVFLTKTFGLPGQ